MTTLSIAEARNGLAEAINRVSYGGERVVFARRGKPVAALVSPEELALLRAVRDYDYGTDTAVAAFRAESGRNLAFELAMHTLKDRFGEATSKGSVQYADFCAGSLMAGSAADTEFLQAQYANEAVDAAQALIRAGIDGARFQS